MRVRSSSAQSCHSYPTHRASSSEPEPNVASNVRFSVGHFYMTVFEFMTLFGVRVSRLIKIDRRLGAINYCTQCRRIYCSRIQLDS